jgi:transposase
MHEERATIPSLEVLVAEVERLRALVAEQAVLIEQQRQRIAELEARLAKDSHNSSKPPSSDSPLRKPPPRSQRKASGHEPGGQKGHRGANRALLEEPDHLVVVPLSGTCTCGRSCTPIPAEVLPERRQVIALAIRREVAEYCIVADVCACGQRHQSDFPDGIGTPVQYGPGVEAFAVYMTQYQLLPFQRTAAVLEELAGSPLRGHPVPRRPAPAGAGGRHRRGAGRRAAGPCR